MLSGRLPSRVAARGERRAVVGMLTGCVQSVFFPRVNAATARVLAAEGCDVIIPRSQGCCGALSLHSGRAAEVIRFAQQTIETFEAAHVDTIVVNRPGCGSAMKEYERLFARLTGLGATGGRAVCQGPRPRQSSSTRWARSRGGTRCPPARPTTTPATWGTRSGSQRRRAPCCAPSPT